MLWEMKSVGFELTFLLARRSHFLILETFVSFQARPQKLPFASLLPPVPAGSLVQDLRWNPAQASMLAVCTSDGSMRILEVSDSAKVLAELPAASGITCRE